MSEQSAVQWPMIGYAREIGWEYVSPAEALRLRGGDTGMFFAGVLEARLQRLNPSVVDAVGAAELARKLALLRPSMEGNREALALLQGDGSVFVPAERRERNVRFIDYDDIENNVFHVTDEWTQRGARSGPNRADVVFLINGIPVAVAETKRAGKRDGLEEGIAQVRRYHRETPELLTLPQVFGVTQLFDLYYGGTWSLNRKNLFDWKEQEARDYERKVKHFFSRPRFLRLLRDYIVYLSFEDESRKVLLRQHQTRAVEKAVARVYDADKRRGLVWHTQGSGKTLTMITIAAKLLRDAGAGEAPAVPGGSEPVKPTVIMIVDRDELEAQLFKNIAAYGIGTVKVAESKRDLQKLLDEDYRGLVVSMIHKFDDTRADSNPRASVVVLVDEAHRTTGGDLGNYLMGALPNATYIGFTGTPIDNLARGKGTFKVFGGDDARGYLDKYSIAESIADGTTVALNYALAPSDLRVDRATLERGFLDLAEAEGVSDIAELNGILERAVELKELMKAPGRVDRIARAVAEHFRGNVEPLGFKAFLVGVDREACALYKKALDRYLPPEYSRVVYSSAHNDPAALKEYALSEDEEKDVRREFRFERLESALAFDSDVVASVIQNVDALKTLFATLMREKAPPYLALTRGWDDKAKERAVDYFAPKERREEFYRFFQQAQGLYDILSPDAFLRPYVEAYGALAELYATVRYNYGAHLYVDRDLTTKTRELLQKRTESGNLELPGAIQALGVRELAALKHSGTTDVAKVRNLRKALMTTVAEEGGSKPFLHSIGERAEALVELYEDRQLTTRQALDDLLKLATEVAESEEERARLDLDENAYAVYSALKDAVPTGTEVTAEGARALDAIFRRYPDYQWDEQQGAALRADLYKETRALVGKDFIAATNRLMRARRV